MRRFVLLGSLLLGLLAIAGTASAHRAPEPGDEPFTKAASEHSSSSGPSTGSASAKAEASGTASLSADGKSVTITGAGGATLTCAVPTGLDVKPFLTGKVEAKCQTVNGVLTLTRISSEDGAVAKAGEDRTGIASDDESGDDCTAVGGDDREGCTSGDGSGDSGKGRSGSSGDTSGSDDGGADD